jgi:hypothetical protein
MYSTKTPSVIELFDTPEHRVWKAERVLRQRVPLAAWLCCSTARMTLRPTAGWPWSAMTS